MRRARFARRAARKRQSTIRVGRICDSLVTIAPASRTLPTTAASPILLTAKSQAVAEWATGARSGVRASWRYGEAIVPIFVGQGAPFRIRYRRRNPQFLRLTAPYTGSAGSRIDPHLHLMRTAPRHLTPRPADAEPDAGGHRAANDPPYDHLARSLQGNSVLGRWIRGASRWLARGPSTNVV